MVVYFDQPSGTLHSIYWSKIIFFSVLTSFTTSFHHKRKKKKKCKFRTILKQKVTGPFSSSRVASHVYFFLNFLGFFFFFLFVTGKDRKTCIKAEKDYFNQQTLCKEPVCWSKYTTHYIALQTFLICVKKSVA